MNALKQQLSRVLEAVALGNSMELDHMLPNRETLLNVTHFPEGAYMVVGIDTEDAEHGVDQFKSACKDLFPQGYQLHDTKVGTIAGVRVPMCGEDLTPTVSEEPIVWDTWRS